MGAENDTPHVNYQISQRADFFETLYGLQTTYRRPIVNTRDEPLCGLPSYGAGQWNRRTRPQSRFARLHVIFYDSNLCHVACLLKVGMMQIVLAMLEAGEVNPQLMLEDPLECRASAAATIHPAGRESRDGDGPASDRGRAATAVPGRGREVRRPRRLRRLRAPGRRNPRLWADTLEKLHAGDLDALTGRLDWVLKRASFIARCRSGPA